MGESKQERPSADDICCFGMIIGLPLTLDKDYVVQRTPIPLHFSSTVDTLLDSETSSVFGRLRSRSQKICQVLHKDLTLHLFAESSSFQKALMRESHASLGGRIGATSVAPQPVLNAILYGPNTLFEDTGRFVAKCGFYLQHPRHCKWNIEYRNPHCLSPANEMITYTFEFEKSLDHSDQSMTEMPVNPIDLFADNGEQNALADANAPHACSTPLYKHQKQALTFMLQREGGWALNQSEKDIWRKEQDSFGRIAYCNLISGHRQRTPPVEFRGGLLIDAPGLGKSLSILSLITSNLEVGAPASPEESGSINTLLIVPNTLIDMWKDELKKHLRSQEALSHCIYYGKDRIRLLSCLDRYVLVITTYSVVRLDWKRSLTEAGNGSTLHSVKWKRIVLDEAHIIREPSKSFAKSVCALEADRRWAVTGTPIQNRLTDLFSLFKFLRCYPFDDRDVFAAHVTQNWKSKSDPASVAKLKTLINCLSLRRPKDTISLLPRRDHMVYLDFNHYEREDYDWVRDKVNISIESEIQEKSGANFLHTLRWLNELRLMCNHGKRSAKEMELIKQPPPAWTEKEAQARFDEIDQAGQARCQIAECCQDLTSTLCSEDEEKHEDEPWISESLDMWCSSCYQHKPNSKNKIFKICNHQPRRTLGKEVQVDSGLQSQYSTTPSIALPTKIRRILQDLTETSDDTKSVVFSAWSKTFDIIQPQLINKSIRCVRLDGSLSVSKRAKVLHVFRDIPDIKVLLATITCGGIGLDLTSASRAYIMEPQWNPMSESQALDRIYRLGQKKEVTTIRYIMRGSYEEQVLKLQRKKKELADLTVNNRKISREELTQQRLQWLKELVG